MFPGDSPYYSGAIRSRKTGEPDGIEVLPLPSEQVMNYFRTNGTPQGRCGNPHTEKEGKGSKATTTHSLHIIPQCHDCACVCG